MKRTIQYISYAYLLLVPVLATVLAFAIGHVSPIRYLPFWLLNGAIMVLAGRYLTSITLSDNDLAKVKWFFIIPWMLIAVFGGMGPPPETAAGWAVLALEQVIRYTILITSGVLMKIGFFSLKKYLVNTPGKKYGQAAATMFGIALPLFLLNMAYWGYFLTYIFTTYSVPGALAKPGWLKTLADCFTVIRMAEVTLIYLATAALATGLKKAGNLTKASTVIYVGFAILGALLNLLPTSVKGPLAIANYLSYIPAFTMLMPYLIALNIAFKRRKDRVIIYMRASLRQKTRKNIRNKRTSASYHPVSSGDISEDKSMI